MWFKIETMNELVEYFKNGTIIDLIIGVIIAAWVIRWIYEIITDK